MSFSFDLEKKAHLYEAVIDRSITVEKQWTSTLVVYIRNSSWYIRQDIDMASRVLHAYLEGLSQVVDQYNNYYKEKRDRSLVNFVTVRGNQLAVTCSTPKRGDDDGVFEIAMHIYSYDLMFQRMLKKRGLNTFKIGIGLGSSQFGVGLCNKSYVEAIHLAKCGNNPNWKFKTFVASYNFREHLGNEYKGFFDQATDYTGAIIYHCNAWFAGEKKWAEES